MNIQIEHREDHTARLTVEVDGDRFDAAKKTAAGALSERVNIPGFRRGKAPYRILANYIGEAAILEEAVEQLSQSIYRDALLESKLDPYGPGALEDAKTEGAAPVFVYNIPLQPVVELGEYRAVRLPYEAPVVTDEQMNALIKNLQRENAVVETSNRPLALGDSVTVDLHAFFIDTITDASTEEESSDEAAADEADAGGDAAVEAEAAAPAPLDAHDAITSGEREVYAHQHDAKLFLDDDDEPLPGFNEAMVGAAVGEERTFELTIPDADPHEEAQRGRRVEFHVTVKAIEVVTLPALNDDFAARLTKDEETPLTLLQLRLRIRENYQRSLEDQYRRDYMGRVLDTVTEGATLKYPEAIVADQVEDMIKDFDQRLRQRNITLQDYMKIYNIDVNALYEQYRPSADRMVRRGLVVRALVDAEGLQIDEARVLTAIDSMFNTGDDQQRQQLRQLVMQNADYLNEIRSDVLRDQVFDRLYAIARGEAVAEAATPAEASSDTTESNDNPDENQQEEPSE